MTVAVQEPDASTHPDSAADRPRDEPAERAMLAAVLYLGQGDTAAAHQLVDELAAVVAPEDLWQPAHGRLWQGMIDAAATGQPLDPAALAAKLGPYVRLLPTLMSISVPTGAAAAHARSVAACATRRAVIRAGLQLAQRGYSDMFDPAVDIAAALGAVEAAAGPGATDGPVPIGQVVERAMDLIEHPENIELIPSGLHDLDMVYPGLAPGELVVIAARTGLGKSLLGLTWARQSAIRYGHRTLLFSLEMNQVEVTHRIIAAEASVELSRVRTGRCTDEDWTRIARHQRSIEDAPLLIDDTADIGLARVRAIVRREARRGLRMVVVDYLQLLATGRADSRREALDAVSRGLKVLAEDTQVPILALAQLNRGPEQRHDRRPALSDIRETGSLEQDASAVILIHRPDAHDRDDRPGEADLIVAKHRNGPVGVAAVAFRGHFARLDSMTGWADR